MTGVRAADIVGKDDYEYAIPFYGTRRPILVDLVLNPDLPVDRSYLNYQVTNRGINTLVAEANGLVVRGKEMAVWAKATLLYDRHGNVVGGIEAVRDITRRKKIEENLRESENRYRTIFESTNAPSTILEEDTTIALANSAYEQLSGYSREELEGRMSWTAFVHKDDLEMTIQYHKSRLNSPDPVLRNHAFRFIARSGELKDIFATVAMIPGTRQTVASFHDITELKNTERALVAERGKLAVTLRSIGDAVIVTDGEGGVELMNQVAELLTGWTENEAKGRTLEEVFVIVNEKTRKRCANPVETVISNGVAVGLANHTVLIARDGTERAIADSGAPIRNESGTITGIVLVFRDVTAERKAQTALLESKKQLSLVLEGTRDAFFDWNISAGTVAASPRIYEMFGYAAGEIPLTFDAWKARTHPDDVKRVIAALEEHLEGRTPRFREEYRMRARSGKYVWILGRGTVVRRDASGKPLRMAGTFTDITERKLTEESLLRSNRRLSLINSITRHDLLNDLTIVLGYLTFIEEAKTLDEVQQYRAKIEESTRKMQSHLDFTQDYQEIGRKTPQYIPVEGALSKALIGLDLTRMKLSIELDEFEILADRLLEKVFFNLIDNATRHGGNEISTIRVTYRETERGLTLIMEDNGTGVPHAEKELIFQKGFGKNTGLGLFLVREVLAITGIDIRETGEPGKGARFEITIPPGGYRRKGAGL
jgi:PAS domain S-box-containing protein